MFGFLNLVALSGCIVALEIPCSVAISKLWIDNNNWNSTGNWDRQRLPCGNDIVKIEEDLGVYINSRSAVKELVLSSGTVFLGDSAELIFSEKSPSQTCKGGEISFTGSATSDWFDPSNWQTIPSNDITLHLQQVPCEYDVVILPEETSYTVNVTKDVTVASVFVNGKEQNQTDFQQYVASNTGIQRIILEDPTSFNITGKLCQDPSGCICGNNKQKDYICQFITCPKLECKPRVQPVGGCCSVCGNVLLLNASDGFNKAVVEQKIRNYLKKFSGVIFVATKINYNIIQVVLNDKSKEESKTAKAAQSIREYLSADKSLHIVKITILPVAVESPGNTSESSDSILKIGLISGSVIFILMIILVVIYLVKKRNTRQDEPVVDDRNVGGVCNAENPAFDDDRVNPLYEPGIEMQNVGFENAVSPPEDLKGDNSSGRENPLYDVSPKFPEGK